MSARVQYEWTTHETVEVRGPGPHREVVACADYAQHVRAHQSSSSLVAEEIPSMVQRAMLADDQDQEPVQEPVHTIDSIRASLPVPIREAAFPHQLEGIAFMLRHRKCLLADEMGLGKTVQALGYASCLARKRALILVPPTLVGQWVDETRRWVPNATVAAVTCEGSTVFGAAEPPNPKRLRRDSSSLFPEVDVVVCATSAVDLKKRRYFAAARQTDWSVVIMDEAHKLQSPHSQITENLALHRDSLLQRASRVVLMTGTPMVSRPVETFGIMSVLFGGAMSYRAFTTRYCAGFHDRRFGRVHWDDRGASNQRELSLWMGTKTLRRREKDTVPLLPLTRVRTTVSLAPEKTNKHQKDMQTYFAKVRALGNATANAQSQKEVQRLKMELWRGAAKLKAGDGTVRRLVLARVEQTPRDEKVLFFAHHVCVREYVRWVLARAGHECVEISGETPIRDRNAICQRLRDATNGVRAGVFSVRAASAGLNCTPAVTRVVFLELDWTVSTMRQAEKRAHRMGATRPVTSEYVVLRGTVEENIVRALTSKDTVVRGVVDADGHADVFSFGGERLFGAHADDRDDEEFAAHLASMARRSGAGADEDADAEAEAVALAE